MLCPRDGRTDKQKHIHTDTDTQTEREKVRQTETERERERGRQTDRQKNRKEDGRTGFELSCQMNTGTEDTALPVSIKLETPKSRVIAYLLLSAVQDPSVA